MSVESGKDGAVHFPKRREIFSFDDEVSQVFPEMALRSIPMYREAHRLHLSMFRNKITSAPRVVFYDVGASRGHFFKAICNQFHIDEKTGSPGFACTAIDNSPSMLAHLKEEMPWVTTVEADASELPDFAEQADFISMFYLLQFLKTSTQKLQALQWAYRNLKPGGVLFLGQKESTTSTHTNMFAAEYYKFRMDNGYTIEEIQAKTAALANAMWPISPAWLEDLCYAAKFSDYVETTKWLMFSTSMCTKQGE